MDEDTDNEAEYGEHEEKSRLTVDMPTKKPRGFKIALLIVAALLVLFVCTIVFLPSFLPIGTIRGIAQTQARDLAGLHVDFANLRFGWNGDLVLDGITVAPLEEDGKPGETLLTVRELRTNVALTPLLSGNIVVNSLDVHGFEVRLVRDAEGRLNLPDPGNPPAAVASANRAGRGNRLLLSAAQAAETAEAAPAIPPIELRRINLIDGLVLFTDKMQGLDFDIGVATVSIEGGASLDEPFSLAGAVHPYSKEPHLGKIDFTGTVDLLRNAAFDPDGRARLEATLTDFALGALAERLGLAALLPSATLGGELRLGYADRKAGLAVPEMRFTDMVVGLGADALLRVPDTQAAADLVFDPAADTLTVSSASVKNDILDATASGLAAQVASAAASGGIPGAELHFDGTLDFSSASHFVSTQDLAALFGLPELPELEGRGGFTGSASLPPVAQGAAPAPVFSLSFGEGDLRVLENATGISAGVELRGVSVAANAELAAAPVVHARADFASVPVRAFVPQLGDGAVTAVLAGGAAFEMTPESMAAEIRADGASAELPATPWSGAATVTNASAHITADIRGDEVTVHGASATVNGSLAARVAAATLRGALAGNPGGTADVQFSGLLRDLRRLLQPVYPADLLPELEGSLRSSARFTLADGRAEALVNSEIDDASAVVAVDPAAGARAEFRAPKSTVGVLAALDTANPARIDIRTFEASSPAAELGWADAAGQDASGRIGGALAKLSGTLDAAAMTLMLSNLSLDVNGLTLGLARGGASVATLSSGLMKIVAGTAEQPVFAPLSGAGDFSVPQMDIGVDNLAFRLASGGQNQDAQLGNLRARLGADGYIGTAKRQLVNIRTASLAATPAAVNSRAQVDLGSGAFLAEYAARIAPAGLAPVLAFLGLPPALLTNATATGTVALDSGKFTAKGAANGGLNMEQGGVMPFETAHDVSAVWTPADGSLDLEIRRLDGNLKTPSGEAAATMAAQPSRLLLSRAGSRGMLDVRFDGSAAPTRALALGLAGVLPQLGGLASTLSTTQAGGVYSAWVQVREKDPSTLGFSVGGTWRGAALSVGGAPFLSEAGELSAAAEGDFAYQANTVRLSRLLLRSESAQMQAEGTASIVYTADAGHSPTGLGTVSTELRFSAPDITLVGRVFPGVLPPGMGLAGGVTGVLAAAGDAANVQISQGAVNFRNFRAVPAEGMEVTIPQGAATFHAGRVALRFDAPATGSAYDVFRMFDIFDGRAAVTGALVRDKHVNTLSAAFALQDGVLSIGDAQVVVGGGADGQIALTGAVDFTRPAPAVDVRLALRNIPLAEVNSELADYMTIREGVVHIPAQQGQAASVAFDGFSEDDILRTLRLENFNFATGPVTLETGPALNAELDKARVLLRMGDRGAEARVITFASVDGGVEANGTGVISFPETRPINVLGDNTADFRAQGAVKADHTIDMRVMVAGNLQKIITVPNLIPNINFTQGGEGMNLIERMNQNAARGNYGVHVTGALESPDISGIGALAGQFLKDVLASVPTQLIGNVLNAPESAVKIGENIIQGITNPEETLKHAPENLIRGLGGILGVGGGAQQQQQQGQQQQGQQQGQEPQEGQPQQEQPRQSPERQLLQGLGRMLGGNR